MANIHGLFSNRRSESSSNDGSTGDDSDENKRYVGGISSQGGGSGLAVEPNPNQDGHRLLDSVRALAENASNPDIESEESNTVSSDASTMHAITMYRGGFTVNDGPHRRLDDPSNSEFLQSLARGKTPRELTENIPSGQKDGSVVVRLVDKRDRDYDGSNTNQNTDGDSTRDNSFQSFSGAGNTLSAPPTESINEDGDGNGNESIIIPSTPNPAAPTIDQSKPITSVQVRLISGRRLVIKVNHDDPVRVLAHHILAASDNGDTNAQQPFALSSGYPPKILNLNQTVEEAGLKGAQVVQKRV